MRWPVCIERLPLLPVPSPTVQWRCAALHPDRPGAAGIRPPCAACQPCLLQVRRRQGALGQAVGTALAVCNASQCRLSAMQLHAPRPQLAAGGCCGLGAAEHIRLPPTVACEAHQTLLSNQPSAVFPTPGILCSHSVWSSFPWVATRRLGCVAVKPRINTAGKSAGLALQAVLCATKCKPPGSPALTALPAARQLRWRIP